MFKEFKEFAVKGNVMDLAVAVIIGGAFGQIVTSFVKDVVMPPIGLLLGHMDFKDLMWVLKDGDKAPAPYHTVAEAQAAGAVSLNYGSFLNTIVNFLIVAFAIFLAIKAINRKKKEEAQTASAPTKQEELLTEIRDLLKVRP